MKSWTDILGLVKILISIKLLLIVKCILKSRIPPPEVVVKNGLGPAYNEDSGTFNILNKKNVSFLLTPQPCDRSLTLLLMVSSGPLNQENRARWRRDVEGREGVRLVFLVAETVTESDAALLGDEHAEYGDIVQSSLADGHRRLGYKILMGYVWAHTRCAGVEYTAKTDDNVVLDMDRLINILRERRGTSKDFLACSVPSRNIATGRSSRPHMRGNWSLTKDELEADILPDFCTGFLYVTSPQVGAALVQVGLALYEHTEVVVTEDYLIAGVLRERLPAVSLETLETGVTARMWQNFFSHCPWLTTVKQTFFNDLVVTKRSSRSGVQYVGHVTTPAVWRFFLCIHMEAVLEMVEMKVEGIVPDYVWDVCVR